MRERPKPVGSATFPVTKLLRCCHQQGRVQFLAKNRRLVSLTSGFLSADEINFRTNRHSLRNPNPLCLFPLETTVKCSLQTFSEILVDFSEGSARLFTKKVLFRPKSHQRLFPRYRWNLGCFPRERWIFPRENLAVLVDSCSFFSEEAMEIAKWRALVRRGRFLTRQAVFVAHRNVADNTDITEGPMKSPLSYQARRELVGQMAPQYRKASRAQKILLFDAFVAMTGNVRTYAMRLLNPAHRIDAEKSACAPRSLRTTGPASSLSGSALRKKPGSCKVDTCGTVFHHRMPRYPFDVYSLRR